MFAPGIHGEFITVQNIFEHVEGCWSTNNYFWLPPIINSCKTTRFHKQEKVLILPQREDDKIRKTYRVKYFHLHLQLLCFWRKLRLTAGKHFTVLASSTFGSLSGLETFSRCLFSFSSEGVFIYFRASGPRCRTTRVRSQVYTVVIWDQRVLALFQNTILV